MKSRDQKKKKDKKCRGVEIKQEAKDKKERETIYQDFHKTRRKTVILIVVSRVLFRKKFVFI